MRQNDIPKTLSKTASGQTFDAEQHTMPEKESEVISTLQATDWGEEWRHLQRVRRKSDDNQYWNKRSRNFNSKDSPSGYVTSFLEMAGVQPGEVVLDMGCGTGSIAIPLAQLGCRVIAADFSEGMLGEVKQRMEAQNTTGVEPLLLAWEDDWQAAGITDSSVDVAIASRSISTEDMAASLDKLHAVARRRCCISVPTGCSPRMDARVLALAGVRNKHGADHQYAWNILQNKGYFPECRYIVSERKDTYDSLDEAFTDMERMIDETIDPSCTHELARAKQKLREWLEDQLVDNEEVGLDDGKGWQQKRYRLQSPRTITWAFISWGKQDGIQKSPLL